MPILKGTGNTLLCSRFAYGKRISTRAKSANSENPSTKVNLSKEPSRFALVFDYPNVSIRPGPEIASSQITVVNHLINPEHLVDARGGTVN